MHKLPISQRTVVSVIPGVISQLVTISRLSLRLDALSGGSNNDNTIASN